MLTNPGPRSGLRSLHRVSSSPEMRMKTKAAVPQQGPGRPRVVDVEGLAVSPPTECGVDGAKE
ncbi:MAG TPA: hypothetical protein PLN41_06790 [Methanothrix sp.]|nr:hypothetical protein [Methanothrix sp.]